MSIKRLVNLGSTPCGLRRGCALDDGDGFPARSQPLCGRMYMRGLLRFTQAPSLLFVVSPSSILFSLTALRARGLLYLSAYAFNAMAVLISTPCVCTNGGCLSLGSSSEQAG